MTGVRVKVWTRIIFDEQGYPFIRVDKKVGDIFWRKVHGHIWDFVSATTRDQIIRELGRMYPRWE
jgi:hypothetical protein